MLLRSGKRGGKDEDFNTTSTISGLHQAQLTIEQLGKVSWKSKFRGKGKTEEGTRKLFFMAQICRRDSLITNVIFCTNFASQT